MVRNLLLAMLFCSTLLFGAVVPGRADATSQMNDLIRDTQKLSEDTNGMTLVWWIPDDFWRISMEAQANELTPAQKKNLDTMLQAVHPYTLVAALHGTMGLAGNMTWDGDAQIRPVISLIDAAGTSYTPIKDTAINSDMKAILGIMKPLLTNMLGDVGTSIDFLLFPAKSANGADIANAHSKGSFSVKLNDQTFKWRLPLGSVVPPKVCPKCGEELNGAYDYCPYDGTKLP
jgi:hypothetical protein